MDRKTKEEFLEIGREIARLLTAFLSETLNDERSLSLYEDDLYRPDGKKNVMYSMVLKFAADLGGTIIRTVEIVNPDVDGEDLKEQFIDAFLHALQIARENVKEEDILEYKKKLKEQLDTPKLTGGDDDDDGPKGMLH